MLAAAVTGRGRDLLGKRTRTRRSEYGVRKPLDDTLEQKLRNGEILARQAARNYARISDAAQEAFLLNFEACLPSDGPIALVGLDSYSGFVDPEWTWESLTDHWLAEMGRGHICAWRPGADEGNYVVRVMDSPSTLPHCGQFVTTLDIGPLGAYLVNYDSLTNAAQFKDRPVARLDKDRSRHIHVAEGRYRCRVLRLFDPTHTTDAEHRSTARVHFMIELLAEPVATLLTELSELPWAALGNLAKDPALDLVMQARGAREVDDEDDWERAGNLYREALERFPERADIYAELGQFELAQLEDGAAAAASFAKARAILGPLASAELVMLEARARGLGKGRELDAAERLAREALELGGENGDRLYTLGDILDTKKMYAESTRLYEQALVYSPNDTTLMWEYPVSLATKLREGDKAEAYLSTLDMQEVHVGFLEIRAANLVWNLGRCQEAHDLYALAFERKPGLHQTVRMACCKLCLGEFDEARAFAERVLPELQEDQSNTAWLIEDLFYLFTLAQPERQFGYLTELARLLAGRRKKAFSNWIFDTIAAHAATRGHSEADWLPTLAKVVAGAAKPRELFGWPKWNNSVETLLSDDSLGEPTRRLFASNFPNSKIPFELLRLLNFQYAMGPEAYSESFYLAPFDRSHLDNWSDDAQFQDALMPFAKANGSGSFYALWSHGPTENTSEMPVVVFGDEGGCHIVAENLRALLQILTFDDEPMVDDEGVTFAKYDDDGSRGAAPLYASWLKTELGLDPVGDPMLLVRAAQEKYQSQFAQWAGRFLE